MAGGISASNRMGTIKKKAQELATLCGVDLAVVCYDANGNLQTWPRDQETVKKTLIKYKGYGFLQQKVQPQPQEGSRRYYSSSPCSSSSTDDDDDDDDDLKKKKSYPSWDDRLDYLPEDQLRQFVEAVDHKIAEVDNALVLPRLLVHDAHHNKKSNPHVGEVVGSSSSSLNNLVDLSSGNSSTSASPDDDNNVVDDDDDDYEYEEGEFVPGRREAASVLSPGGGGPLDVVEDAVPLAMILPPPPPQPHHQQQQQHFFLRHQLPLIN
ncbi:hypothetical protein Tsubulata_033545 [Turnera subulata]|uniref:MADS-box domain-containing protein n=1 Tax=Turnera subulata TaxID=218843 RepID=A0A9Q0GIK8_9ROSI|nr:hypothetical protein Tsubulata_033545 [Turnera subulata]